MSLLRSYMTEINMSMCVLICLDVYRGLKKQKSVTNKQKMAYFVPKNHFVVLILCWETPNDSLRSYIVGGKQNYNKCKTLLSGNRVLRFCSFTFSTWWIFIESFIVFYVLLSVNLVYLSQFPINFNFSSSGRGSNTYHSFAFHKYVLIYQKLVLIIVNLIWQKMAT